MSEIPKAYEPQQVESKWYQHWLDQQIFTAHPERVGAKRPAYSIVIPPPNVTGVLHMGHVLNNTIQDILARKARMDGKEALWLPGTDHAGIATEGMVAKQLATEEKKSKRDIGREEFLKRVWTWKEKHGGIIIDQLKKLGCSCDWTRERFTMDPDYVRCVQKVFVDLFQKGLIYRGKRMVNWCPATQTALSDEEVEMKPQKGFMYHFKVEAVEAEGSPVKGTPLTPALSPEGGEGEAGGAAIDETGRTWLTIATTRPETIPGDTAVAVNPKDPRYAHLIGKFIVRPLPPETPAEKKRIPIVGDEHVDFAFGTGVLKVTPAHDKADFDIGQRHQLPVVDIMNPDGSMNTLAGEGLSGRDRFVARKIAVEKLRELGALVDEKPYENNVGFSQRAGVPIEPRLSEQWFLKYPSVEKSKACVAEGRMKFHPDRWAKVYDHWLANIQDWCISRQLWWGHRIPVWYRATPGPYDVRKGHAENVEANQAVEERCQVESPGAGWEQDPNVLDTWFSSWLWPFATMGWTGDEAVDAKNPTLQAFYPTTDLVTGPDIIFFWVARMIMAGYEYRGEMPFRNVYFTGIVRDKNGEKMSKMLGNSPDPIPLMARFGADALRFGILRATPLGADAVFEDREYDRHPKAQRYDFANIEWKTERFPQLELARNLCNKLWNACRFRQMQGGAVQGEIDTNKLRADDKWILLKLHQAIKELNAAFADYKFNEAASTLYRFFWSEYCDWYVESAKAVLNRPEASPSPAGAETPATPAPPQPGPLPGDGERAAAMRANVVAVMDFVLSHTLRLFHPFLPFITEELWHGLGYAEDMPEEQGGRSIMTAPWPKAFDAATRDHYSLDSCYLDFVNAKFEMVTQGRDLRRQANVPANKKVKFIFKPARDLPPTDLEVMKLLLNAEPLEVNAEFTPGRGMLAAKAEMGELYLPLEGLVDTAAETARLTKEIEKIQGEITKVEQKLGNADFVNKVPPQVLAEHRQRLEDWHAKLAHARTLLESLGSGVR